MIIVFVLNLFRIAKLGNGRCNRVAYIPVPAAWPLSAAVGQARTKGGARSPVARAMNVP